MRICELKQKKSVLNLDLILYLGNIETEYREKDGVCETNDSKGTRPSREEKIETTTKQERS